MKFWTSVFNNMRIKFLIIILIAYIGCTSNDLSIAPIAGVLNQPVSGKEQQNVLYQLSPGKTLNIQINKIEEARCPSDAQCVWQGYVKVTFHIEAVDEVELITPNFAGSNASEAYRFTLDGRNYQLALKDVSPYPTTKNYEEPKSVDFVVEEI